MKKKIIGITAASLVLGSSIAYASTSSSWNGGKGPGLGRSKSSEMTAIMDAVENDDYETWKSLMNKSGDNKILENISTQDDFEKLVEAHKLREAGNNKEADAIMEELGMPAGRGGERNHGKMDEAHKAVIDAVQNDDYEAWKTAMANLNEDSKTLEAIDNEDDFEKFVEAQKLLKDGDKDAADAIFKELGVEFGPKDGDRKMNGFMEEDGAVETAIENSDYETWKGLMEERGGKILDIIDTEEEFDKFAEAKKLQKDGDYDAAKTILDELGFPFKDRGFARFGVR